MAYRIVISGYYGCGNLGDEAVLAGMLESFRKVGVDARVTVLSADPADTIARHPGVDSIQRFSIASMLLALRRADLFISGGGSLLQDVTSVRSLRYYLFVLRAAQALGTKTMVFAQGIGPLTRPASLRAVSNAFKRTNAITVRDRESAELLQSAGVADTELNITADPAFLVESHPGETDRIREQFFDGDTPILGVSLRPWPDAGDWLKEAIQGIRAAAAKIGARILVVPMQYDADSELWPEIRADEMILGNHITVGETKSLIGGCDLLVGMRLHSLIFAADEGTPFVPLVYDPKVSAFAEAAGFGTGIHVKGLTADALETSIVEQWQNRDSARRHLGEWRIAMRKLALRSAELAKELLQR